MKKPKTKVSDWHRTDKTSDKGITCFTVQGLDPWDTQEAYEEMIDALIGVQYAIEECKLDNGGVAIGDRLESRIKEALKKAGVE